MFPPQESDLRRFKTKTSGFSSNMYFIKIRSYVHLHHINIHSNLCYKRIKKKRKEKKFFVFAFNNEKKRVKKCNWNKRTRLQRLRFFLFFFPVVKGRKKKEKRDL